MSDVGDFVALIAILTGVLMVVGFGSRCSPKAMVHIFLTILVGIAFCPFVVLMLIYYILKSICEWPVRSARRRRVRKHRSTWAASPDIESGLPVPQASKTFLTRPLPVFHREEKRKEPRRTVRQKLRIAPLPPLPTLPEACIVCAEEKPAKAYAPITITEQCRHETHVCRECVAMWIETQLPRGNEPPRIRCPQEDCPHLLRRLDIKYFASKDIYYKYEIIAARHAQISQPDFCWCMSPYGCPSGQIHNQKENGSRMQCRQCSFHTCTRHMVPWHAGETCEEYASRNPDPDVRSRDERIHLEGLKKLGYMDCPICSVTVHKIEGCDHITFLFTLSKLNCKVSVPLRLDFLDEDSGGLFAFNHSIP
ncbi:hypothetical protein MKZ38_002167 [Zalerion maritima]|uniref:RBR-type E3 ubiquitin transferase n=1 Tax=Zalerion maritima TaxID=339359 RepID=A0AAD5WSM0_9PEZI|nr:hypothetical protein MKZ38_002167 [Zalerion maritima]